MEWTEIKITVPAAELETAAAIATMASPGGIYIEDYSDLEEMLPKIGRCDYIDENLLSRDRSRAAIRLYLGGEHSPGETLGWLTERLSAAGIGFELDRQTLDEGDWAEAWKKHYHPFLVGPRLWVRPSWEPSKPPEGALELIMDPESAFGSGEHETTRLCLSLLQVYLMPGTRLLDMGCGSGILAIAAALLGAEKVIGVDIDANAAATAARNAAANAVNDRARFLFGDAVADPVLKNEIGGDYDLVTANIVADVLIAQRRLYHDCLKPGGVLLASGIIEQRGGEVIGALREAGFRLIETKVERGWMAAALEKKMPSGSG